MTDGLQILAASALPIATRLVGIDMPDDAGNLVLAYIGLAAIAFIAIRLFWAPYSLWKEQGQQLNLLNLKLAAPEIERRKHQAGIVAANRLKMAGYLWQDYYYLMSVIDGESKRINKEYGKERFRMLAETDFGLVFLRANDVIAQIASRVDQKNWLKTDRAILTTAVCQTIGYLHGNITAEVLWSRLPPYIEEETLL